MTDLPLFTNTRINQQVPIDSSYLTFTNSTIPGTALISVPTSILTGTIPTSSLTGTIPASSITGTLVLLTTLTASNSATLDDTTHITPTYDEYMIALRNLVPVTNSVSFKLRISTDGGSTYKSSGYLSQLTGAFNAGSGGAGDGTEAATDSILLTGAGTNLNTLTNTAGLGVSGTIYLHAPNGTSSAAMVTGSVTWSAVTNSINTGTIGGWYNTTGSAINAIRFLCSSGNISTGTIKIYGIGT